MTSNSPVNLKLSVKKNVIYKFEVVPAGRVFENVSPGLTKMLTSLGRGGGGGGGEIPSQSLLSGLRSMYLLNRIKSIVEQTVHRDTEI